MAELFEITGIDQIRQRLQAFSMEAVPLAGIWVQEEMDAVLEASLPLVPIDTQSLHDSGHVEDVTITGAVVQSGVRYGGTEGYQGRVPERYAIFIHEVKMNHPRGGQDKYLETPMLAATAGMLERLADAIRIAL